MSEAPGVTGAPDGTPSIPRRPKTQKEVCSATIWKRGPYGDAVLRSSSMAQPDSQSLQCQNRVEFLCFIVCLGRRGVQFDLGSSRSAKFRQSIMDSVAKSSPAVQKLQSSSTSAGRAEDEAWKKNTDCVYFLASPLTCKKGSECEYRHSESARLNPRDCWYWTNSVCLSPKCPFRHPPLDGLVGAPVASPGVSSLPSTQAVSSSSYSSAKQGVPCIFFQKGYCLKGDRCPFLHGSIPIRSNKLAQVPAAGATELPPPGEASGVLEKCTREANVSKIVEALPEAKTIAKAMPALPRDGPSTVKYGQPIAGLIEELPNNKEITTSPINNGNARNKPSHSYQGNHARSSDDRNFQNDKDTDELLRESSPGFDVLVDDEVRDTDYYHNDQYARMRAHDGRNLNELEIGYPDEHNSAADVDPELYHDRHGYDSYEHLQERYAWEQRRGSSNRSLREAAHFDRRGSVDDSDLRRPLSKQRRVNGLRSVVNPDYVPTRHGEDRNYPNAEESSLSSRLHGRIKLPKRSPVHGVNKHQERENDRGRNWGRLSPIRPLISSHHRRLQDRLKGRIEDDFSEGKTLRDPRMKRDVIDGNSTEFAGPKSLAELKVAKQSYSKEPQMRHEQSSSIGKHRYSSMLESSQPEEGDLSFEGPKPLSEILKRKREAEAATAASNTVPGNKEDIKQTENKRKLAQVTLYSAPKQEESLPNLANNEEGKAVTFVGDQADAPDSSKKMKLTVEGSSQANDMGSSKDEGGLIADGDEDHEHELEEYVPDDGDYEYDIGDVEGFNMEAGENADPDEYMEEDDEDDFAKKIGVMFS
ncbi:hypothetical protein Nepgr_016833 [Nepenthes gracilis]|uniref:C3H1-type domain-containing protein n=1 Tax=Nepenthes gracilis TaxID=150966 RepID=A0AAD3SQ20_NEPGR|nr:hypothetical protein Nepgr_016833 [Nepenthes gracilis]